MRGEIRICLLVIAHMTLLVTSVFIMDWAIRDSTSADLWAVSHCNGVVCVSRPLDDGHAATTIWQSLLFAALVIWQGGARALGFSPRMWGTLMGFMIGAVGVMSVLVMAVAFGRTAGLTLAPVVLASAYGLGFVALVLATRSDVGPKLARARQIASARAIRRA
jgi:hypothetical protein